MAGKGTAINRKEDGNGKASIVYSDPSVLNPNLESIVYSWILNPRKIAVSVSTFDVVTKASKYYENLKMDSETFYTAGNTGFLNDIHWSFKGQLVFLSVR